MKVLVCGGRDYQDQAHVFSILDRLHAAVPITTLINGCAKGADTLGRQWAVSNSIKIEDYPAQWDKYGKSAGFRRNTQMLEEGRPDLVLAFPGGRGTAMMCDLASRAGVKVQQA